MKYGYWPFNHLKWILHLKIINTSAEFELLHIIPQFDDDIYLKFYFDFVVLFLFNFEKNPVATPCSTSFSHFVSEICCNSTRAKGSKS